ncbi:MAG: P-loop NTPase [Elusimicrobiota bacterium]
MQKNAKVDMQQVKKKISERMSKIKKKILVLSNKGGVGKSAVSIFLAQVLNSRKNKVGILDSDMHGPSTVKSLGLERERLRADEKEIIPLEKDSIKVVSIASLLESEDSPLIWRGPLKGVTIRQFLSDVKWGELDYLVIDSPPGTGDEPLSVIQLLKDIDAGVVVTTPQNIALLDSRKCINFLKRMGVPVAGIIENMSGVLCPHCGEKIDLFKTGGGKKAARELDVPFLGAISFDPLIVDMMDKGEIYTKEYPKSKAAKNISKIVDRIEKFVNKK